MTTLAGLLIAASVGVGQADGEKTFKSFTDHIVGGTWVTTIDGERLEHSYRRIVNEKFVQLTLKGGFNAGIAVLGVDPETNKCKFWGFGEDGAVSNWTLSQEGKGVWYLTARAVGPNGEHKYKGRVTAVDADTTKEELLELVVEGEKQEPRTNIWKRTP
jgi:hypothetical protein